MPARRSSSIDGPQAAKRDLYNMTGRIIIEIENLLDDRGFVRQVGGRTEIDIPEGNVKRLIQESALDCQQYLGTFAGLFRRPEHDDYIAPGYGILSLQCMEALYSFIMCRSVIRSSLHELTYRSWLGFLISS